MNFKLLLCALFITCGIACKKQSAEEDTSLTTYVPISVGKFLDDWTCSVNPGVGGNFELAEFRLWVPDTTTTSELRAILILADHFNSNGLGLANDPDWRSYAIANKIALLGVRLEMTWGPANYHYSEARNGSGEALLKALTAIAGRHQFPKVAELPLLIRGYSAGGMFAYYFTAYKPERVVAFANFRGWHIDETPETNKGIPGLFLLGEEDPQTGVPPDNVQQLIRNKRLKNGLWGFAVEPEADHFADLARSDSLTRLFFSSALNQRVKNGSVILNEISQTNGWLGNNALNTAAAYNVYSSDKVQASWLIDEAVAKAWVKYQKK